MIILLEIDNVVCYTPPWCNRDAAGQLLELCRPRRAAIQQLRTLHGLGHDLGVVTSRGPQVAAVTRQQLDAWMPDLSPHLITRHRPRLVAVPDYATTDKQREIQALCGDVYVGSIEDEQAAVLAGARFVWGPEFELHGLTSLREAPRVH